MLRMRPTSTSFSRGRSLPWPKAEALQFRAKHNLNAAPADGLDTLLELVRQKQADRLASLEVTTKNGQKGTSQSGAETLIAEPVISLSANAIDTQLEFDCVGKKLVATFTANNNDVKFLGAFDAAGTENNITCFAFVRLRADSHPPMVIPPWKSLKYVDPALAKATEALADIPKPWTVPKLIQIFTGESNAWMRRGGQVEGHAHGRSETEDVGDLDGGRRAHRQPCAGASGQATIHARPSRWAIL